MPQWFEQYPVATPIDVALHAEDVKGPAADVARSIYQQESGSGKNTKTSNAGAVGGMQVMPATFKRMADDGWDINDPVHNARAGVRYVKTLHDLTGGDPALTAVGYYGGEGAIPKARAGIAVSDPRNPNAPNTLQYGQQVAARVGSNNEKQDLSWLDQYPPVTAEDLKTASAPPIAQNREAPIAQPTAAPPQESRMDTLLRQPGLAVRAGVNAVTALPVAVSDAVTGAVNSGLDLVRGKDNGFRFQPASKSLNTLMTKAGLPEPQNPTERVVQDVATGVGGAAGSVVAGGALSRAAGAIASSVGKTMAEGPALQMASGAAGSGASAVVRENGGSEGAQVAAGIAGALAPGFAIPAMKEGGRHIVRGGEAGRQNVEKNIAIFNEASGEMPTLGQATQDRSRQAIESVLAKMPGSAGVMVKKGQEQADALGRSVQRLSDELAPGASAVNAGEAISNGINSFKKGIQAVQQHLYENLDQHIHSDTPITVSNTQEALKALNADIPGAPNLSAWFKNARIQGIDKALHADLEQAAETGALPYQAIKKLRTLVGRELSDGSLVADVPRSKWNALYGALSEDLGTAAKAAGPTAEHAWSWANQFTRTQMERLDQLAGIVGKDSPEKVFAAAISGTAEGNTIVKRVVSALPKADRREIAAAVLQRLGRATPGQQNAMGDAFSPETFLTNASKLSPSARETLFGRTGSARLEETVQAIGKMAENIRQGSKVFANPSGTAQAVTLADSFKAAAIGLLTGHPIVTATAIGVPAASNIAARIVSSPNVVRFAAGKTALPEGAIGSVLGAAEHAHGQAQPKPDLSWLDQYEAVDPVTHQPLPKTGPGAQASGGAPATVDQEPLNVQDQAPGSPAQAEAAPVEAPAPARSDAHEPASGVPDQGASSAVEPAGIGDATQAVAQVAPAEIIRNRLNRPFTVKIAAINAAKQAGAGFEVEAVPGGFIAIKRGDMKNAIQKLDGIQPEDKVNRLGQPFTVRIAAQKAAKEAGDGFSVVPVPGGFAVRKSASDAASPSMDTVHGGQSLPDGNSSEHEAHAKKSKEAPITQVQDDAESLAGDILHPKTGKPFTIRLPALKAAKAAGEDHHVAKVKGGWVARKSAAATA